MLKEMNSLELLVYGVMLFTSFVIAWHFAKNGYWESGIERPLNKKVIGATFIGFLTVFAAGMAQKYGFIFSLLEEKNMSSSAVVFLGGPLAFYFLSRLIMPRGLLEYNRARIRTTYWTIQYYYPGKKLEIAKDLANLPIAESTLKLFDKSIAYTKKGARKTSVTTTINIDNHERDYYFNDKISVGCPNCSWPTKISVNDKSASSVCVMCCCSLSYKIVRNQLYLTAFGDGVISNVITPRSKANIAVAYEEKALLLRMMNLFDDALESLDKSEEIILQLLASDSANKEYLGVKSLIIFRRGEIAQSTGNKNQAQSFYQESLAIDQLIGVSKDHDLVKRLLKEVS